MREFISENETINQWTWWTVEKFNAIENHFKDFNAKLALDDYNKTNLAKFVQFLIDKKDMCNSTVKKQLGYLKWFFRPDFITFIRHHIAQNENQRVT